MKKLFLITAAALCAGPALAGSVVFVPEPEPLIIVPVVQEWTGPYAGVQLGYGSGELGSGQLSNPASLEGMLYGAHLGYNYDLGNIVLGAEIDYNFSDVMGSFDGDANVPVLAHIKARVGYDAGQTLIYGVAGLAYAEMDLFGGSSAYTDTGFFGGIGVEHKISTNWTAGLEYLYHSFDDFGGSSFDIELQTIHARASFHF